MDRSKRRHSLLRDVERFSRLFLVKEIGINGISKLRSAKAVIVGCGATGTHVAELLVRSGFGELSLIDKDYVDVSNLYRTSLFTEDNARKALPKAVACAEALRRIDSSVRVNPIVAKLNPANAEDLLLGHDIIIDGTDNYTARLIINDVSVKHGVPWVLTGVGTWYGNVWLVNPKQGTPCMRCVYGAVRDDERGNVCDVLGVVPTAVSLVASIAAGLAIEYVLGLANPETSRTYFVVDAKRFRVDALKLVRREDCVACGLRRFEFLNKEYREELAKPVCGTKAVEVNPPKPLQLNFHEVLKGLKTGQVLSVSEYTLRVRVTGGLVVTVFRDGRAIVDGTTNVEKALEVYETVTGTKLRQEC